MCLATKKRLLHPFDWYPCNLPSPKADQLHSLQLKQSLKMSNKQISSFFPQLLLFIWDAGVCNSTPAFGTSPVHYSKPSQPGRRSSLRRAEQNLRISRSTSDSLGICTVKNQVSKGFKELLNDVLQFCHNSHYEKMLARDDSEECSQWEVHQGAGLFFTPIRPPKERH